MVRGLCQSCIRESYILAQNSSPPQLLQTSPPLSQDARTFIGTENFSGRHGPSPYWEFYFHAKAFEHRQSLHCQCSLCPGTREHRGYKREGGLVYQTTVVRPSRRSSSGRTYLS